MGPKCESTLLRLPTHSAPSPSCGPDAASRPSCSPRASQRGTCTELLSHSTLPEVSFFPGGGGTWRTSILLRSGSILLKLSIYPSPERHATQNFAISLQHRGGVIDEKNAEKPEDWSFSLSLHGPRICSGADGVKTLVDVLRDDTQPQL